MCNFEKSITWNNYGDGFLSPLTEKIIQSINDPSIYVKEKDRHAKMVDGLYSSKNNSHNVVANNNVYVIAGPNGAGKTVLRPYIVNLLKLMMNNP